MIDSHCHLDWQDFAEDFDQILIRARENGVVLMNHIAMLPDGLEKGLELARNHKEIYLSAGCHAQEASKWKDSMADKIRELNNFEKFIGIGEIGLDYFRDYSPLETQKEVLLKQLELAKELQKPFIIHCRDKKDEFQAYDDMFEIITSIMGTENVKGVMHCFSGRVEDARRFSEIGMHISYAGHLTYKKNDALRETVDVVPLDKILIETDAPFLAPQNKRGKRNEPAFMIEVLKLISELKSIELDEMNKITEENTRKLFQLPKID